MRPAALLAALPLALAAAPAWAQGGKACQPADLAALSGWNGVWIAEGLLADVNGREPPGALPFAAGMKLLGLEAPWTREGWLKFGEGVRLANDGGALQQGWGFPVMMSAPAPFSISVAPAQTTIVSQYREVRQVYTDGRPHAPDDERWATIWGDSVGCWEGDTLRIETISVRYDPSYNFAAPSLSENAVFVERIRQTAPDRLESEIVVTDPETLERPWETHMVYLRHPVLTRLVHEADTLSGNRVVAEDGEMSIGAAPERPTPPPLPPEIALGEAELEPFTGTYAFEGAPMTLIVERRGDGLVFKVPPVVNSFMPMLAVAPRSFVSVDGGTFDFTLDAEGRPGAFTGKSPMGEPMAGKRAP